MILGKYKEPFCQDVVVVADTRFLRAYDLYEDKMLNRFDLYAVKPIWQHLHIQWYDGSDTPKSVLWGVKTDFYSCAIEALFDYLVWEIESRRIKESRQPAR